MNPSRNIAFVHLKSAWHPVFLRSALLALALAPVVALRSADPPDTNYDESKVPSYTLPEALVCFDGQAVEDTKRWREKRRPEILRAFAENVYGRSPELKTEPRYEITETDAHALGGLATRQQVTIRLFPEADAPRMDLLLLIPNAALKPVPAFLREVTHSPDIWFCRNYRRFAGNEAVLPVDQHELIALIAPPPGLCRQRH